MASTRRSSLNRQVLLPLVGACLVAAIGLAAITQVMAARQAAQQSRARLESVAKTLADTSFPINSQVLSILQSLSGLEFIVCDANGNLRDQSSGIDSVAAKQVLQDLSASGSLQSESTRSLLQTGSPLEINGRNYRASILYRPSSPDSMLLLLEPQLERQRIQQQLALTPLITGLATLLLVGAVALALSQRLVHRIAGLEFAVRGIAKDASQRITITGPRDQLTNLAESVNGMADELRSVWKTIRETERSRLLSQVAGGLAHQLRNAITGIHMAVQLHRRDCPLGNQESLTIAEAELARTAEYIQQLLHSASGKQMTAQPSPLGRILNESESLLSTIAHHRGIRLVWQRDPTAESHVVSNHELMRSALTNLVLNALDAAGPGGDVCVTTSQTDTAVLIRVSDSGPGPGEELSEHLFDPFVSSKPEGLGVGLTVVRSAAESLRGHVRWYRAEQRTLFEFELAR